MSGFDPGPEHDAFGEPHGHILTPDHPAWRDGGDEDVWGHLAEHGVRHNPFHDGSLKERKGDWGNGSNQAHWGHLRDQDPAAHAAAEHALRHTVAGMHIAVAVPSLALHDVIDDGRMRTAFETGAEGHWHGDDDFEKYMRERNDAEYAHFRYPMRGHPEHARPVYGYLTSDPHGDDSAKQYGHHTLVLSRPAVAHRTTFTGGDSLDHEPETRAAPLTEPRLSALSPSVSHSTDPRHIAEGVADRHRRSAAIPYIEAQVHGGVGLHHVHYAILRTPENQAKEPRDWVRRVGEKFSAAGVPWVHTIGYAGRHEATDWGGPGTGHHSVFGARAGAPLEGPLRGEDLLITLMAIATGAFTAPYRPEVIWHQGHGRYIVELAAHGMGQIADLEWGVLYPPQSIASILARGYWQRLPHPVDAEDVLAKVRPVT